MYLSQYLLFIRWQLVKVNAEHIENNRSDLSEIIPRRLNGFLNIQSHFLCDRVIRRAVNVMFMGFPYIAENGVPCFVRHMTEKIFFYLCGKNRLRIEILICLLVFLNDGLPLFFQRLIKGAEGRGCVTPKGAPVW